MVSSLFLSQLNKLDDSLFIRLNKEIERFIVCRKDRSNNVREILTIETPNQEFSYPNYEHITKLYEIDTWQNKNVISSIDHHNNNLDQESNRHISMLNDEVSKLATRTRYF